MINTYNETHLHKTLKHLYTLENEGSTEETKVGDYIADIVTKEGNIIEIQTGNLSHLTKKILYFIDQKRKVTVVYPLVTEKIIETTTQKGTRKRKSPVKNNIYTIFKELTGLYPVLLSRYFTLEILEVSIIEERIETPDLQQSKNGRRRFRKNWNKTGKRLQEIKNRTVFHGKKSWKHLLPPSLPEDFTTRDFYTSLTSNGVKLKLDQARVMLWVYTHMGLIQRTGKKGRSFTYRLI